MIPYETLPLLLKILKPIKVGCGCNFFAQWGQMSNIPNSLRALYTRGIRGSLHSLNCKFKIGTYNQTDRHDKCDRHPDLVSTIKLSDKWTDRLYQPLLKWAFFGRQLFWKIVSLPCLVCTHQGEFACLITQPLPLSII